MQNPPSRDDYHILDEQTLRDTLRFWATGVTIVAVSHNGRTHGMTVNSFTSLSLDPPLVLVSLEKGTRTHDLVKEAGAYAVTILGEKQESISELFAGRDTEESDRFNGLEIITLESGSPILKDGLAFFDCRVNAAHDVGTHTIFVAEVLAAGLPPESTSEERPLIYFNRRYRRLKDFKH